MVFYSPRSTQQPSLFCSPAMDFCRDPNGLYEPLSVACHLTETLDVDDRILGQVFNLASLQRKVTPVEFGGGRTESE